MIHSLLWSPPPSLILQKCVIHKTKCKQLLRKYNIKLTNCKTAVCNGDQPLDFSVPELVRSQSTFSTDPEVLQNFAGFTLCSSSGPAVGSNGFDTMYVVYTDLLCVPCIGLLSAEFSTVNTVLGRPMFWKPLCLLSTPESVATTNYQLT